jgi:hypothetical protein
MRRMLSDGVVAEIEWWLDDAFDAMNTGQAIHFCTLVVFGRRRDR